MLPGRRRRTRCSRALTIAAHMSCHSAIHAPQSAIEMGRRLENLEQFGIDVVLERRHGIRASILRAVLYAPPAIDQRLRHLRRQLCHTVISPTRDVDDLASYGRSASRAYDERE